MKNSCIIKLNKNPAYFYQIDARKDLCIVVSGSPDQAPGIEITRFPTEQEAAQEAVRLTQTRIDEGYVKDEKPSCLSIFSLAIDQLARTEAQESERYILTLKALVEAYHTRNRHPFVESLGVAMRDEELVSVPVFDEYLQNNLVKLSSSALVSVFQMTLQDIRYNFAASSIVAAELVKRKDEVAQLALVKQFITACEYYDAGHRNRANTNLDLLLDTYFPQFESSALLALLTTATPAMLDADDGDALDELFVPALQRTNDRELQQSIIDVLASYKSVRDEDDDSKKEKTRTAKYFERLLKKISKSASPDLLHTIAALRERWQQDKALQESIEAGNLTEVEKLLSANVPVSASAINVALDRTLKKRDLSILKIFKEKEIFFSPEGLFQDTEKNIKIQLACIESGLVDPNFVNAASESPLFFAGKNFRLLKALLEQGVSVDRVDHRGSTVLNRICSQSQGDDEESLAAIKMLLEYKANPDIGLSGDGYEKGKRPLHFAVERGAIRIAELLIDAGANVNAIPDNGKNALVLAHARNNTAMIKLLTNAGAKAPESELLKVHFLMAAEEQRWDDLVRMEQDILSSFPDDHFINLRLAQAYYYGPTNYSKSERYARKALDLKASNGHLFNAALNCHILSLLELEQPADAIESFFAHQEGFQSERSQAAEIVANLAAAFCSCGRVDEGIQILGPLSNVIEEQTRSKGVMHFNMARLYAQAGNITEMLPFVVAALERLYTKDDFLRNEDFAAFYTDELFLFILNLDHTDTIELEESAEDLAAGTIQKVVVTAFNNNGGFGFEDEPHEFAYHSDKKGEDSGPLRRRLYTSKTQALVAYFRRSQKLSEHKKDNYWLLGNSIPDDEISIQIQSQLPETLDFSCGREITQEVDTPIVFVSNAISRDNLPDIHLGEIPVCSNRLLDLFVEAGITGLQTFPVVIKGKKRSSWSDFVAFNVIETIACGDFPKSTFADNSPSHGVYCKLMIDADKAKDALMFRLQEHLPAILIHRTVVKHIIDSDPEDLIKWEFSTIIQ